MSSLTEPILCVMHFLPGSRGWYQTWTSFGWNGGFPPVASPSLDGMFFGSARLGRQEKGAKRRRAINEKSLPKVNDSVLHYEFCHANLRPTSVKGVMWCHDLSGRPCFILDDVLTQGIKFFTDQRDWKEQGIIHDPTGLPTGFRGKLPPMKLARSKCCETCDIV